MKFDHIKIEEKLQDYWRDNKKEMKYFLQGKEVFPESVSSCAFQLKEIESEDGYDFEVTTLNLRVQIDSVEAPYNANFLIKVVPELIPEKELPEEKIVGIQNNRINLYK